MRRWLLFALGAALAAWFAFVVWLDVRYDLFPAVTFGGLKIAAAGVGLCLVAYFALRMVALAVRTDKPTGRNNP